MPELTRKLFHAILIVVVTALLSAHTALTGWVLVEITSIGSNQAALKEDVDNLTDLNNRLIDITIRNRERELEHLQDHAFGEKD